MLRSLIALLLLRVSSTTTQQSTTVPPDLSINSLVCYDCSETLISKGKPYDANSTCRYLYGIKGRYCLSDQNFCMSEYVRVYNTIKTFVRTCASKCTQGCLSTSWWLTNVKCTECCTTNLCNKNDGNSEPGATAGSASADCPLQFFLFALLWTLSALIRPFRLHLECL